MFPMLELINFAGSNTLFLGALSLVYVAVFWRGRQKEVSILEAKAYGFDRSSARCNLD